MSRPYATDEQYDRWFMAQCCRCGRHRNKAGSWPDGYVCRTCSDRAVRTRGTCPGCGQDRALPGLRPGDGAAICTTCAGFSQTFDCARCGFEGKLLGGRLCERCTLASRLTALLDDGTGRVRPELTPLFGLLAAMDRPASGLAWLEMRPGQPGNAAQMLRQLGLGQIPLAHDAFHQLQPWRTAAHLEELLMASGVLPAADKYICSFQRWLPGHLAGIADPGHAKTIRLFATWHVLPRLRARADRSHITPSIRRFAAEQIKYATGFLRWLGEQNSTLASCRQIDIDAWYAQNSEHGRTRLRGFLNWAMQSRQCRRALSIPAMKASRRAALREDERLDALRRLLTSPDIPMRLRIAGIIVLLYAQPLTRVVRLTIDDVLHDGGTVLLRLGEPASPIPAPVASLLQEYIAGLRQHDHRHQPRIPLAVPRPPGRPAVPSRPPVRTPGQGRRPGRRRPRRRHPAAAARDARPRRRRRSGLPRQDHHPSPQRGRQSMEPIRRRRSRKVTTTPGSTRNPRQLNTRARQDQPRS